MPDGKKSAYEQLKPQWQLVVDHYTDLSSGNFNWTKSAILAGYSDSRSAEKQGWRLSRNVQIQAAIKERLDARLPSDEEIKDRISSWSRGSLEPFLDADDNERIYVSISSKEARKNIHLIKKIKQKKRTVTSAKGSVIEEIETDIEIHDPKDAADKIAKMKGLYVKHDAGKMMDGLTDMLKIFNEGRDVDSESGETEL